MNMPRNPNSPDLHVRILSVLLSCGVAACVMRKRVSECKFSKVNGWLTASTANPSAPHDIKMRLYSQEKPCVERCAISALRRIEVAYSAALHGALPRLIHPHIAARRSESRHAECQCSRDSPYSPRNTEARRARKMPVAQSPTTSRTSPTPRYQHEPKAR